MFTFLGGGVIKEVRSYTRSESVCEWMHAVYAVDFIPLRLGTVRVGSLCLSPVWSIAVCRLQIDVGSIPLRRLPLCACSDLASVRPGPRSRRSLRPPPPPLSSAVFYEQPS